MKPDFLTRMKQEHQELGIAIRVFERMTSGERKQKAMKTAAVAAVLADAPSIDGEMPSLKNMKLTEAIPLALKAANRPMVSRELALLLKAGGLIVDPRGVGTTATRMMRAKQGIRKTAAGYTLAKGNNA